MDAWFTGNFSVISLDVTYEYYVCWLLLMNIMFVGYYL